LVQRLSPLSKGDAKPMSSFEVVPLPEAVADRVRRLRSDDHGNTEIEVTVADKKPGYPCRVCLEDAEPGEPMLLFSYSPFNRPRPYRNVGPIFIHGERCSPYRDIKRVPTQLRNRLLALRAYDESDSMLGAHVVDGNEVEVVIQRLFEDPRAKYIHVHNARPGCFACQIERA
jgi:hypothetical protein